MKSNPPKSVLVDDKKYWKNRHAHSSSIKASGIKSVSKRSNSYVYRILFEQYSTLLNRIDKESVKTVFDAGYGDGYFLSFLQKNLPKADVYGIDISLDAKRKAKFSPKQNLFVGDIIKHKTKKKYDLVHCFDVLYHILDDNDYRNAVLSLTRFSKKYIIIHERFLDKDPVISSKHVRFRTGHVTEQILNSQGFYLERQIPTHFFAMRLLTYKLNAIIPRLLYMIDRSITAKHPSAQLALSSHQIRVYTKK